MSTNTSCWDFSLSLSLSVSVLKSLLSSCLSAVDSAWTSACSCASGSHCEGPSRDEMLSGQQDYTEQQVPDFICVCLCNEIVPGQYDMAGGFVLDLTVIELVFYFHTKCATEGEKAFTFWKVTFQRLHLTLIYVILQLFKCMWVKLKVKHRRPNSTGMP